MTQPASTAASRIALHKLGILELLGAIVVMAMTGLRKAASSSWR